jgi:hypothetical protein
MKGTGKYLRLNYMDRTVLAFHEIDEPFLIHAFVSLEGEADALRRPGSSSSPARRRRSPRGDWDSA